MNVIASGVESVYAASLAFRHPAPGDRGAHGIPQGFRAVMSKPIGQDIDPETGGGDKASIPPGSFFPQESRRSGAGNSGRFIK